MSTVGKGQFVEAVGSKRRLGPNVDGRLAAAEEQCHCSDPAIVVESAGSNVHIVKDRLVEDARR